MVVRVHREMGSGNALVSQVTQQASLVHRLEHFADNEENVVQFHGEVRVM